MWQARVQGKVVWLVGEWGKGSGSVAGWGMGIEVW